MKMNEYKTQMIELEKLNPYERNAKLHPKEQVEKLAKEISEVGWTQPIVCDSELNIIAGHGRRLAALELGLKEVPVHILSDDVSPERIKAMRLFDNRVTQTGFDSEILAFELQYLSNFESALSYTGYEQYELDSFLNIDIETPTLEVPTGATETKGGGLITEEAKASGFKQVQLLFTPEQYEIFKAALDILAKKLKLSNMTDVIFALVQKGIADGNHLGEDVFN